MNLILFEILKLRKSRSFIFINLIPLIALLISYMSFLWYVDQDYLGKNLFFYQTESYVIDNPFYVYQSRFYGMLFFIVLPIYVASLFSYSSFLDLKNSGYRLYANLNSKPPHIHLIKFVAVLIFFIASLLTCYFFLALTTITLPTVKDSLVYDGFDTYLEYSFLLLLKIMLLAVPSLILHYWISLKMKSPTLNVLIALVILIVTFSVYNNTPYFIFIKGYSDTLKDFMLDIVDIKPINWHTILFGFNYSFSGGIIIVFITAFFLSDLSLNWWNKIFKHRKYIQ